MKQSCNVIKDLLILYEDGACSEESKKVVEEHLKSCSECRKYFQRLQCTEEVISEDIKEEFVKEDVAVKQGFKKMRRRWMRSMIAVFMLIPILAVSILCYHEAHGAGVAFSNLDDIYRCMQYLRYIEKREFEKAVEMTDFEQSRDASVESTAELSSEQYQEYMREKTLKKLQEYDALGVCIDNITYDCSYKVDDGWTICISFDEHYPDGSKQKLIVHLGGESMVLGAVEHPYMDKIGIDDYIDDILVAYSEEDPLGYQEFPVAFELKEGEKAIIRSKANSDIRVDGLFNITFGTGASLIEQPYLQNAFATSVPGKYSVIGYTSQGEMVYLTEQDMEIEIVKFE